MRTTLTIDDDVAVQLDRLRRQNDVGFKDLVNDVLRRGLREMSAPQKKRKPFRTVPHNGGKPLIDNIDNIAEVLALIEGETYK
jgi:hypothetical protein